MKSTRPVQVAVIGVVAGLLLGGCGADEASPDVGASAAPSEAAASTPSSGDAPGHQGHTKGGSTEGADDSASASPSSESPAPGSSSEDGADGTAPGSAPALEMPEAPESPVSSLSELLPPTNPAPLVTTPLPRAATAEGRLVRRFPDALRPTRAARVQSSSLSPMGDRLQVGLVATTSLSPGQVLLAYRTRLARRGMDETAAPPSVAGSHAAAFRRGDSVVTLTVTPRGAGTSYSVHASLRSGNG